MALGYATKAAARFAASGPLYAILSNGAALVPMLCHVLHGSAPRAQPANLDRLRNLDAMARDQGPLRTC